MTDKATWLERARKRARVGWGYEGMVDEFPEWFDREFAAGTEPESAVDEFADAYDLSEPDPWTAESLRRAG